MMSYQLTNRTVIVSGAAGKIGRTVCLALGSEGANIVVNDTDAQAVAEIASLLSRMRCQVLELALSANEGTFTVDQAVKKFGTVHAIINATLGPVAWKPVEEVTDEQFHSSFLTNVMAPLSILRAAWPHFKAQKYGRVVNFTSDSILGFPTATDYTMTKGAIFGMNKTLSMEGSAFGITVNCVSPIAFVPNMESHIQGFSREIQHAFRDTYKPSANVPMILMLISEHCSVSGQVFSTAGWSAMRCVWGVQGVAIDLRTADDCLREMDNICDKTKQPVFEPESMIDFTEFQAAYTVRNKGSI